jgi:hypothetical protein
MTTPSVEKAVATLTELAKGPDIGLTDFVPHLRALLADHANQRALLVEAGAGELVEAWSYELASGIDLTDGSYVGWQRHITAHKPCVPDGSIRNLKPLYAATFIEQRSRVDREVVARIIDPTAWWALDAHTNKPSPGEPWTVDHNAEAYEAASRAGAALAKAAAILSLTSPPNPNDTGCK